MKQIRTIRNTAICMLALGLGAVSVSCGDDSEGRVEINDAAPSQVTAVSYQEGPGEVRLEWKIPTDPSFMYTKLEYKNSKGEDAKLYYSKEKADENGMMHAVIQGFASIDPVEFRLYACSVRGKSKDAVVYSAIPGAPAFLSVANTLSALPAWGGIDVNYENDTDADVIVSIDYHLKSDTSKEGSATFTAKAHEKSKQFVALSVADNEFINGEDAVVSLKAQDVEGNAADPKSQDVRTKKVTAIDRSEWTFPGYADTNDAQTGYSSQEAGGEGGYPKGRVVAMLDGDEGTFWHTAWKTSSDYPHFFIIDMGKENMVTNITIRRRTGNNGTNIGQTIYTCPESKASGSSPDEWNWTDQGWNPFDRNSDRHQMYGMPEPESARYIKVYYSTADKGGNFVMVSEFNAYTPAE